MNIFICANCFPPIYGGTEVYSFKLSKALSKIPGNTVTVITPYVKDSYDFDNRLNFNVIRYKSKSGLYFYFFYSIIRFKINRILITHRANFLTLAYYQSFYFNIPYYLTVHGTEHFGEKKIGSIVKKVKRAKKIFAVSKFVEKRLINMGVDTKLITNIPPGTDTDEFHPGINTSFLKDKYNLDGKKVIVSIGRIVEKKGFDMVIRSMPLVLGKFPSAVCFIVGAGRMEKSIKALAKALCLQDKIIFTGHIPHYKLTIPEYAFYSISDVFVMPSRVDKFNNDYETFGIVYLEANACGKPVIGGKSGGVEDAVVNGETGIIVDPLNKEEIANAIISLLSNKDLAERLGRNGRKRVIEDFRWEEIAERINKKMALLPITTVAIRDK